ncbi:hypothetical protein J7337_003781 [Fusarium musae]|uniref:Beta-ketoacyl synthase-like N-terminal domain-containing protein n=1 Tax=Fusarium musae TaxID=1042133 RepID=A0A9P8DL08_9HYPO|nr:hypothetical protein J7337_003781 [Fusarium musae]KAG9503823.1 hypothetical protein J7337_003781 [Fusarium musae]
MSDIAIIGYSFKLPQDVNDDTSFWAVLQNRRNLASDWPGDRVKVDSCINARKPALGSTIPVDAGILLQVAIVDAISNLCAYEASLDEQLDRGDGLFHSRRLEGSSHLCSKRPSASVTESFSTVQYATEYKQMLDWGAEESPQLEPRIYTTETFFNALGQSIRVVAAGGGSLKRSFDLAGRLAKVEAYASVSSVVATASIDHVTYEPDDQVGSVLYGNGALVKNTYGISDHRLLKSRNTSTEEGRVLQDISSWYDCMGRLVRREDKAQQTLFFDNCRISPTEDFTYDSLGQLVESRGRELTNLLTVLGEPVHQILTYVALPIFQETGNKWHRM